VSDLTEPLHSLEEAVRLFLPGGRWTVASLRTERRKGRLKVEKIAGKIGVTESAIREMRRLCQEEQKAQDCSSAPPARIAAPFGSSSTEEQKKAQDAAKATARALTKRSRNTSPTNTSRPGQVVALQRH
jgi:hypothetical protein